ncbi:MAG TPA: galactose-1-phosphate uridylyltransferase [Ktedonobacteraceae bacterium]|jgi:UDPglucose--hexose-1-phosphate uridylyltransferase|nr:galactose-1-phosphate uridylyltransferase [Ktedonobacteraceae bacterium]
MSEDLPISGVWEERWHPLREEWIVVAAHRQDRPWIGATVSGPQISPPDYVESCYLCPGNQRVSGTTNPHYTRTYVFDNDHPCVGPNAPREPAIPSSPYRVRPAQGLARVLCYSPRHNLTMAEMPPDLISEIIEVWQQQTYDLGQRAEVNHVLCFENKGEVVGVSNPHPHGQIYATNFVFKTIEQELQASQRYHNETGRTLFAEIISAEQATNLRILYEDEFTIAFVPYFARYAYEVYVAPKRSVAHIHALRPQEIASLARALQQITIRFDNLWQMSFPYVMALHQAPTDGGDYRPYHFFLAFHPPLRRSTVLKYLAGPEIGGGNFISDTSPEAKAAELLAVPTIHYRESRGE